MLKKYIFNEFFYFLILSSFTFIIWFNKLDFLGMAIFAFASFLLLIFVRNTIHTLPIFFNMLFMISQTEWSLESIPIYLYILPVVLILGFIVHFIRFKGNWVKGKLTLPLLLMLSAMVFSIFNTEIIDINYGFYLVIGLFYVLIYIFFIQTIKGDQLEYLIKLFIVLGILVSCQVLAYYLGSDDVIDALRTKEIDLGWGISNFVATYLIIFISTTVYYIKKKPGRAFTVVIIAFEILMLLFTLSRGGILAFIATIPLLIYYLYHGQKNKLMITLNLMVLSIILTTVILFRLDYFIPLYERFMNLDLEGNGRVELWVQAYHKFREYPLVGAGLFARVEGDYFGFYHNTFMHTLASLGIVGFISLMWQIVVVLKVFLRQKDLRKYILLIALIGANIHGLVDNVYFMPQFMILFFAVLAVVEIHNLHEEEFSRYWRLKDE